MQWQIVLTTKRTCQLPFVHGMQASLSSTCTDQPLELCRVHDSACLMYRCTYTAPAVPGLYRLHVHDGEGRHISGSPFSLKVAGSGAVGGMQSVAMHIPVC